MFSESFKMLLLGTLTLSQFVSMMSIEQKVGQLFLFGFQGISYNDQIQLLIDKGVRGFVIFGRNVKDKDQVKELVEQIKTHCDDIPPFVAVDQEGGMVARIRDIFVPPNAMLLGSVNDTELTYKVGYLTGKALRDVGINMDFAPVLDVNSNPFNPIIGVRSFWNEPTRVATNGVAFFKGLLSAGVIPVGKHFPGHGDTDTDSHTSLPVINKPESNFIETDVSPFKIAVENKIPALMTAHILLPFWDNVPATISKKIISYLREKLGFDGVIISDDMLMKAVSEGKSVKEAVKQSLLAGVDMFIIWKDLETQLEVADYILQEVKNGNIPEEVIDNAVKRITKLRLLAYASELNELDLQVEKIWEEISDGIALCKGNFSLEKDKKYLIFFPYNPGVSIVQERAYTREYITSLLKKEGITFKLVKYNLRSTPYRYIKTIKKASTYDGVIIFTMDTYRNKYSAELVNLLIHENKNNLLIAIQSPYDYLFVKDKELVNAYITTYDWNEYLAIRLLDYLIDNTPLKGECILTKGGI